MFKKILFSLTALLTVLTVTAAELLRNPNFSITEPLPAGVKKNFEKNQTEFNGKTFPRWWNVRNAGMVKFDKQILSIQSKENKTALLEARNYRISRKSLGNYACKITVKAKGTGKAIAGFYCYNAKGKFVVSLANSEPMIFDGKNSSASQLVNVEKLTAAATDVAFFLKTEGDLQISHISCTAVEQELPDPTAEFQKLSVQEKIARLKQSRDWKFAAAALEDKSPEVRNIACYQLGNFGKAAAPAMNKLAEMLKKDSYQPVRVHAARALCSMGSVSHELIRDILLGNDGTARLTLGTTVLGMKEIPDSLKKVLEWSNPPVSLFNSSTLPDGNFEASEGKSLVGWTVEFKDGAEGEYKVDSSMAYQGEQSLKLTKTNGKGYILLKSTMPVTVSGKDFKSPVTFRFFFKTADTSYNTLLLPRFINEAGHMQNDDPGINGGRGIMSQSRLRNTPPQAWTRRSIMYKPRNQAVSFYPAILLYGNPATVWIDAVQYPAVPFKVHESAPTRARPEYSIAEACAVIAEKPEAKLQLKKEENGKLSMLLNGKPAVPVMHAPPGKNSDADFRFMHKLGKVKLHVLTLNTAGNLRYEPFAKPVTLDKINKEMIFRELEKSLCHAPDAVFILNLSVLLPADFVTQNPEEAWLNAKGEKAYGNNVHVQEFGTFTDKEFFYWPSQYSEKGWQKAEEILRDLLLDLKKKPYAKAIAGVFVSGGHDGQFMIPYDDYSKPALQAWRNFLRQRYSTDEALAKAWHKPGMTIETATIPRSLKGDKALQGQFLLDPAKYQANIDYREFKEARMWQNAGRFAKLFKEVFGKDKFAMTYCMGGGWKKNFKAFFDCGFDAFVPQASYYNRLPGLSGGVNMVDGTFLKHKTMVIAELDTRSWVRSIYNEVNNMALGVPFSKRHFQNLVMKEAGRQLAHGHGYWFYDISSNSFRHPAAMEVIRKTGAAAEKIVQQTAKDDFVPETALVYHQKSIFYDAPFSVYTGNWASEILDSMAYGLRRSGVPMTAYFMEDLLNGEEYKKHKIFVFMNAHMLTDKEREFINTKLKKEGRTLIWIHSTGMLNEQQLAPELTAELTGFKLKYNPVPRDYRVDKCEFKDELSRNLPMNMGAGDVRRRYIDTGNSPRSRYLLPCFDITDNDALLLGKFGDGGGALGVKKFREWTSVFCAAPGGLDGELLYNLAKQAGAYTVTRPGLLCEVNSSFVSLHACVSGTYRINLPRKCAVVKDAMTGKVIGRNTSQAEIFLPTWKSQWLILE